MIVGFFGAAFVGAAVFAAGLPVSLVRWKVVRAGVEVEVAAVKPQMLFFLVSSSGG
jgi:hypothetical protein